MANAHSLANLRPWTPEDRSYIGHPKRPPTLTAYIRTQTADGREMADFMLGILRGQPIKKPDVNRQRRYPTIRDRMEAANWLANRAFGMPKESIEISEGEQASANRRALFAQMPPEDREALRTILVRALEAQAQEPARIAPQGTHGPHA